MWPWLASVAWAECTFRAGTSELVAALDAAEEAYASMDVERFEKATTEVDFVVPCLDAPLDPPLAARLHRLRGLGRFAEGDTTGATEELVAARALAPDYVFPLEMLPEGFELRLAYEALPAAPPTEVTRLPRPRGGTLLLDGTAGRDRPDDRSVLFQRLEGERVVQTTYLSPADPVPWYPGVAQRRTTLLATGAATAVVAGVLYGAALDAESGLERATGDADLEARALRANALGWTAIGLFGAAGAQLLAAAVVDRP